MAESALNEIPVRAYSISSSRMLTDRKTQSVFFSEAGRNLVELGFDYVGDIEGSLHLPPGLHEERESETTAVVGVDDALSPIRYGEIASVPTLTDSIPG